MLNNIDFQILNIPLAFPVLVLVMGAIILLLCSAFKNLHRSFYVAFSLIFLVFSFALMYFEDFSTNSYAFFETLQTDSLALGAQKIILIFSAFYVLMDVKQKQGEFYALLLFIAASLMLMVSSSNLILIFIGLESSSLALYTLIAMRGTRNAISSAIKYFSVAAVGSGFFVLACALIYMKTGSLAINKAMQNSNDVLTIGAFAMMLVIAGVKLSLMPFHFWLKDVYYASNANLVAFISVVPKIAMVAFVCRLFAFVPQANFIYVVMIFASFSMLISSIVALSQNDVKKMLAYSSISHSSFALMALIPILSDYEFFSSSLDSVMAYWTLFAFANYGTFLLLSLTKSSSYDALAALFKFKPVLALLLGIFVLSLAGIPPFGVFWGKVMIMLRSIEAGYWYLALIMALSSALIVFAYFKIIIYAFFKKNLGFEGVEKLQMSQILVLTLSLIASLFYVLIL
ncbi:NADH-quinone oxidoreductase subunit N [Campylobacter sp. US33a]|uniref:NADH-quinone oxidoreductase subunit N n=1 Tax=Campylobacter sp. CCS1377 TaxID=3158229 RepID=A0AAU7E8A6_9BACT|nr:NADH-quinone oxidoreductase subunit N [Campylobacter sp. US33a]TEY03182.1 NADH-quinone oxidoreductase subunit N [Campylobacter sp. US33a]